MQVRSVHSSFVGEFSQVTLRFSEGRRSNVFASKNNKTLAQTLAHRRYVRLRPETEALYRGHLGQPLGEFLLGLKVAGDQYYRRFLNPYGDLGYCTFEIADSWALDRRGLYAYYVGEELRYIGRCRDSMRKRVNQGYGKIHPKNCYLDGQATNCHLNALISGAQGEVSLWLCPRSGVGEIETTERRLLQSLNLAWNIQRG